MKHFIVLLVCVLTLAIIPIKGEAQNCVLRGKTFEQVDSSKPSKQKDMGVKTQYVFKTKDGKEYPIYVSKQGKAFIWRVSKKTGKQYKQYLPEVTKQLQTQKKFVEEQLGICFTGDIKDFKECSKFLNMYLDEAKRQQEIEV